MVTHFREPAWRNIVSPRATSGKKPFKNVNPAKQAAILKAAEKVFATVGFHEARISDIAREAQVSGSTIYDYFSTKENLLFSIPAETIRDYQQKNLEILQYVHGAANRLRTLIYRHLSLYASNENYAKVTMLILKGSRNFLKTDAYKVVQESARITTKILEEGIKTGEFRPAIKPYLVRAMIWGTIEHLVVRRSLLGEPRDLMALAEEITSTILEGIVVSQKEPALNVRVTVEQNQ
jgi:TetR/AcrR family fatty acid metabolism transcriptional regulator